MTILEIYNRYLTPPNLQQHMLTVTKVALTIANNWNGDHIDKNLLKKAGLLHDLANIVKFDFKKHPEFLGPEQARIDYWITQQQTVISKYGHDDHEATIKMLDEIGIEHKVRDDILVKSFANAIAVDKSKNWEAKILLYSDMRVGPFGIVSLQERLDDVSTRLEKYKNDPNLPNMISAVKNIEINIQANLNLDLQKLSIDNFELSNDELMQTKV